MNLLQRIGYYLGGFSLGLIILAFFLNGKKTSCAYSPEARVLKNINTKKIFYSQDFIEKINVMQIDTLGLGEIIKNGDINFSNSKPRQKPCGIYIIQGLLKTKDTYLTVENCDSISKINNIAFSIE